MLIFLQNQHTAAFAHDKAAAALVEGNGRAGGIVARVQRHAVAKGSYGQRRDSSFCAAGHHGIGITVQNAAVGLSDGIGTGSAGCDNGHVGSLEPIANGN